VTFKAQDRFGGDAAPATTGAPLRAAAHEVNDEAQAAGAPLAPTVASWAALPRARLPEGWSPDAPIPAEAGAPVAQADAVAHAGAPAAQAKAAQQHDAPARRRAHVRRHHRAAHAPQPQEQPADTPDEKTEAVPQPVDNSLRSVLDKMFRPD
jgi:hypothetical protein